MQKSSLNTKGTKSCEMKKLVIDRIEAEHQATLRTNEPMYHYNTHVYNESTVSGYYQVVEFEQDCNEHHMGIFV